MVEKAYKFRLYPNKEQEMLIQKTFGCVRFVYNYYLDKRINEYHTNKKNFTFVKCCKDLTKLKQEHEWLKEPDKCALQNALKNLDRNYQYFFKSPDVGFPKFKSKKNRYKSYRSSNSKGSSNKCYTIEFFGDRIKLPKLGMVKLRGNLVPQGRIINATISQEPDGKYYISICCTDVEIPKSQRTNKYVGIDLGIKDFAITSDGDKFPNPKFLKQSLEKEAKLQRAMDRKTMSGANWNKARVKLARLRAHIRNQRKDMIQKLSHYIITHYDVICLEDLKIKNLIKNHHLAQSITDAGWYEFINALRYKAEWYGKVIVQTGVFFPSTKTCNVCGFKHSHSVDLGIRKWTCPECGTVHDRDINAAINIRNEGLRLLNNVA